MTRLHLIGASATFRNVIQNIDLVAPVDSAVLIQGETGTGKEVVARAVHERSARARGRFVALNCAAIPSALLESELFGYEKGAFTGAVAQTIGRFQAADGGTLFLDEIGDLPLELQPKLLRALQEKQFERLGGGHTIHVNVRVIAATNQSLEQMVQERKFRADLYYRLNVFPISLPPLRERREDIALLATHFVQQFAEKQGKIIDTIPSDVLEMLERHAWHGNIRELQNVIERGVIMTTGSVLSRRTIEHLTLTQAPPTPAPVTRDSRPVTTLADAERTHIAATLRETNWVIGGPRGAAAQLGLPRTTLIARMQRLGIAAGPPHPRGQSDRRSGRLPGDGSCAHLRDDAGALQAMKAVAG
ncbi:MAG TPA: sigma 54-interacting transcriptional regulator [Bryobacteraceae bacterium]|nr:sigma 54-interacting transcriptional regulator [Bryobacteraceae bacterium]